jgi:hypothetical protein
MPHIRFAMLMFAKCHSHVIACQKRKSRTYGDVIGCKINVSRSHGNVIHWQINVPYSYDHFTAWQTMFKQWHGYGIWQTLTWRNECEAFICRVITMRYWNDICICLAIKRKFYQWRSIIPPILTKREKKIHRMALFDR